MESGQQQRRLFYAHEARPVGDADDLLELAEMASVLLEAGFPARLVANALEFPTQGDVTKRDRFRQAMLISRAYPEDALILARKVRADWHALLEPARWWSNRLVEREDVVEFCRNFVEQKGRWPRTDELRRRFGFRSGHLLPGEGDPNQRTLA